MGGANLLRCTHHTRMHTHDHSRPPRALRTMQDAHTASPHNHNARCAQGKPHAPATGQPSSSTSTGDLPIAPQCHQPQPTHTTRITHTLLANGTTETAAAHTTQPCKHTSRAIGSRLHQMPLHNMQHAPFLFFGRSWSTLADAGVLLPGTGDFEFRAFCPPFAVTEIMHAHAAAAIATTPAKLGTDCSMRALRQQSHAIAPPPRRPEHPASVGTQRKPVRHSSVAAARPAQPTRQCQHAEGAALPNQPGRDAFKR